MEHLGTVVAALRRSKMHDEATALREEFIAAKGEKASRKIIRKYERLSPTIAEP